MHCRALPLTVVHQCFDQSNAPDGRCRCEGARSPPGMSHPTVWLVHNRTAFTLWLGVVRPQREPKAILVLWLWWTRPATSLYGVHHRLLEACSSPTSTCRHPVARRRVGLRPSKHPVHSAWLPLPHTPQNPTSHLWDFSINPVRLYSPPTPTSPTRHFHKVIRITCYRSGD